MICVCVLGCMDMSNHKGKTFDPFEDNKFKGYRDKLSFFRDFLISNSSSNVQTFLFSCSDFVFHFTNW